MTWSSRPTNWGKPGHAELGNETEEILDRIELLSSKPEAFLRQSSAQSITNGSWQALNFNAEDIDTHDGHSTVTNTSRYTCKVAGTYDINAHGGFAANSTGHRGVRIHKNGSLVNGSATYFQTTTADVWSSSAYAKISMAVGDYVEVYVIQDSGGSVNSSGASGDVSPSMRVTMVNPAA